MDSATHPILEEQISFGTSDGLRLGGILAYPELFPAKGATLLLAPHPHFGGNLENNVIKTLAQGLARNGAVTLRFNYRGVGCSEIALADGMSAYSYFEAMEKARTYDDLLPDAEAAFRFVADAAQFSPSPVVIGYSFGALLGGLLAQKQDVTHLLAISPPVNRVVFTDYFSASTPTTFIGGDNDFTFSVDAFNDAIDAVNPKFERFILTNCDHFYRGKEETLLRRILAMHD